MGYSIGRADTHLSFIKRVIADLQKSEDNFILFDNLQLVLVAIEVDLQFAEDMLIKNYKVIFKLISEYPNPEHKIAVSLFKLIFEAPQVDHHNSSEDDLRPLQSERGHTTLLSAVCFDRWQ
jgi:hypothetical protein